MKVLIVEDENHVATALDDRLGSFKPSISTVIARSRSSALEALQDDEFDFIVCDLRLPPYDGGTNTNEAHGLAVHAEARAVCPGTPCLFFTGYDTSGNVLEQLSSGGTQDVFGNGENYGMTRLVTKDRFLDCVERLRSFNVQLAILDAISIDRTDDNTNLDHIERRALQMLARGLGGTSIETSELGGLSGAQTLRAQVKNDQGHVIASYFVKIDFQAKLKDEREGYYRYVNPLLKLGDYPALGREIRAGIGKRVAYFYQLADEYTESLFDVLQRDEGTAIAIVEMLRENLAPWDELRETKVLRIGDLRTHRIKDSTFSKYYDTLGSAEVFENIEQKMTLSCQHGDLHGCNVLCNRSGKVVVIDFGNVGLAPICIDPVLLELSILFHSSSPFRTDPWPTAEQAESWFNLEKYLAECPVAGIHQKMSRMG